MESSSQTPSLREVVNGYQKFLIEDYQRTYSWQKEQIDELFQDLFDAVDSGDNHFFGTLILQETTDSKGRSAFIVDGQQRLTTIFILTAYLRDILLDLGIDKIPARSTNEMPIDVINKAWSFLIYSNQYSDLRFESSRYLSGVMRDCVMAVPDKQKELPKKDIKANLQLRKAINLIRKSVDEDLKDIESPQDKVIRINKLLDTIFDKFLVLKVGTADRTESLDIFLTLNNRGLPLGPSDIVRGEVISDLSLGVNQDQKQLEIHKRIMDDWNDIIEMVGEPETFLRHFLVATDKIKVTKKVIVKQCSDRRYDKDLEQRKLKTQEFWDSVISNAKVYQTIISPKMGGELQYNLELMEGLGKSHRILLLGLFSKLGDKEKLELTKLTRLLAFKNVIAGLNAQKLEDFYQTEVEEFRLNEDYAKLKKNLVARIDEIELNAQKFFENETDLGFVAKAVLHSINYALSPNANQFSVLDKQIHIEHIAPRTKTLDWIHELNIDENIGIADYEETISKIGNLTLLDPNINSSITNKPFSDKKTEYGKSGFEITRDFHGLKSWHSEDISLRTTYISEMFENLWSTTPDKNLVCTYSTWKNRNKQKEVK